MADDFQAVTRSGSFQPASGNLKPVPKFAGSSVRDPQRAVAAATNTSSQSLQWRTSPVVEPPKQVAPTTHAAAHTTTAQHRTNATVQSSASTSKDRRDLPTAVVVAAPAPSLDTNPIRPAGLHTPGRVARSNAGNASAMSNRNMVQQAQFQLPSGAAAQQAIPDTLQTPPASDTPLPDFFTNPFGDLPETTQPATPPAMTPGTPATSPQLQMPELPPPAIQSPAIQLPGAINDLRQPSIPDPAVPQPVPLAPEADDEPMQLQPAPQAEVPPRREIEDFQMPRGDQDRRPQSQLGAGREDISLVRPVAYSCDDFRRSISEATIQKVSLDISPPFQPQIIVFDEYKEKRRQFDEQQKIRDWQSIDGRKLGRGRLRDLAYEKVVIETEFGTTEELPVTRISEADLAYISQQWGLPKECLIEQPQFQQRQWEPSKITWKASNLMHKPLYFEEVNLERYGHTAGPILQPVISSAHFFANIAVLPYKMGVHLPNECQYALGYYRPGDCAPWITQPVPLSLRGALFQAGAVTGAALLIP